MKKYVAIAAALSVSTLAHAAQQQPAVQKKKVAVKSTQSRISARSLRTRTSTTTASTTTKAAPLESTANAAAVSENVSSQRTSVQQSVQSSQSSATRLATPMSTSTVQTRGPRMIPVDNFKASANVYYYGSSVMTPLDSRVPDFYNGYEENNSQDRVSADVHLMAGYRFHPNYTFSINPQFAVAPSNSSTGDGNTFLDPIASFVRLSVGEFATYKNLKWNGDLRYYPGITEDLRAGNVVHYFRTGQNVSFKLSKDTNLAAYNTLRYYARNSRVYSAKPNQFDFRVTMSPTIEHQINDQTGVSLSYNMDLRKAHSAGLLDFGSYLHEQANGPFLELGASLDLIKNVNLNPYVDSYVRRPNLYGTRWGVNVGWTIL